MNIHYVIKDLSIGRREEQNAVACTCLTCETCQMQCFSERKNLLGVSNFSVSLAQPGASVLLMQSSRIRAETARLKFVDIDC